jgi:hypothetical protein
MIEFMATVGAFFLSFVVLKSMMRLKVWHAARHPRTAGMNAT